MHYPRRKLVLSTFAIISAAAGGVALSKLRPVAIAEGASADQPVRVPRAVDWVAAAPGRVEPISGEIVIAAMPGARIDKIVVRARDRVDNGALLAVTDDREQIARVHAAETEVLFRESERDNSVSSAAPHQRQSAEDSVANAQSEVWKNQIALDRLVVTGGTTQALEAARTSLANSQILLAECQRTLDSLMQGSELQRPTRTESALAAARSDRAIAYVLLEKTRVRAPLAGTILGVNKLPGDAAGAAPDDAIMTMGDVTRLRVKTEVAESDISRIAVGQRVVVRSDAFRGQDFFGSVSLIAPNARPRALVARQSSPAPRSNVIEVIVELDASDMLLPGMRVDAFFEPIQLSKVGEDRGLH